MNLGTVTVYEITVSLSILTNIFFPPFPGTSGDPLFDMGGLDHALPTNGTEGKKDAKSFLGTHADLVNLDNLVTKPPGLILHAHART